MNIDNIKLVKWLHELAEYRKAEAREREEFNNYNWKSASEFMDETNEILGTTRSLSAEATSFNQQSKLLDELADIKSKYAYLAADFDNYKKRVANSETAAKHKGKSTAIFNFLAVYDNIERLCNEACKCEDVSDGVKTLKDGCAIIKRQIEQILQDLDAKKIEVAIGDKIDINKMEVVAMGHDEDAKHDTVLNIIRSGWTCDGHVVRYVNVVAAN